MLDMKFLRENPDIVRQNIKNKFQDEKLPMVDKVIELDEMRRNMQQERDDLRARKNVLSKQIGALMKEGKKEEADKVKAEVEKDAERLSELEGVEAPVADEIRKIMYTIPNII
ncbi:MAG: serine--tRNA ligase, partial [Lachnospiraceae bacterium]|nr:serine--tRNA ligase [Lachnospiraceae bacterium]